MKMNRYFWLLLFVALPAVGHADYKARCIGGDGKSGRCSLLVGDATLKIHYSLGNLDVVIPGGQITALNTGRPNDHKNFAIALQEGGGTITLPLATQQADEIPLGIAFVNDQGVSQAVLVLIKDAQKAEALKLQLETIRKRPETRT